MNSVRDRRVRIRRIGARIVAPSMLLAALAGGLVAGPGAGPALAIERRVLNDRLR